jgi:hypothetical protein
MNFYLVQYAFKAGSPEGYERRKCNVPSSLAYGENIFQFCEQFLEKSHTVMTKTVPFPVKNSIKIFVYVSLPSISKYCMKKSCFNSKINPTKTRF